jgi:DNA-binding NtrC family response regulator
MRRIERAKYGQTNAFFDPSDEAREVRATARQMNPSLLDTNDGNRKKTAAQLGIGEATLYRKLRSYSE